MYMVTAPRKFTPAIGREYYCDNYKLSFNGFIGRWQIWLRGSPVISDNHKDWKQLLSCFDWKPWTEEQQPEQLDNTIDLFDSLEQTGVFDDMEAGEFRELVSECYQEYGYYTSFEKQEHSRRYEGF